MHDARGLFCQSQRRFINGCQEENLISRLSIGFEFLSPVAASGGKSRNKNVVCFAEALVAL